MTAVATGLELQVTILEVGFGEIEDVHRQARRGLGPIRPRD